MKNKINQPLRCQFASLPETESDIFDLLLSETTEGETSFLPIPPPSEKAPEAKSFFQKRGRYLIYAEICEGWQKDSICTFDSEEEARGFAYRIFNQPEILEDGDEFDSVFSDFRTLREFETGDEEEQSDQPSLTIEMWDGDSFTGVASIQLWFDSTPGKKELDQPSAKLLFLDGSKRNIFLDGIRSITPSI